MRRSGWRRGRAYCGKQISCYFLDFKTIEKQLPRGSAHIRDLLRPHIEEASEKLGNSKLVVLRHQSGFSGFDFPPDVHLVRYEHGFTASQSLGNHDAEVLLVGRQYESIAGVKGSPFHFVLQHPGPMDAVSNALLLSNPLKFHSRAQLVRPCDDKIEVGVQ